MIDISIGFNSVSINPNYLAIEKVLEITGNSNNKVVRKKVLIYCLAAIQERLKIRGPVKTITPKSKTMRAKN